MRNGTISRARKYDVIQENILTVRSGVELSAFDSRDERSLLLHRSNAVLQELLVYLLTARRLR